MQPATKRYYVYILADQDTPFYVGKGQGKRVYNHRGEAKRGHACHKCNKIRKLWREGREYTEQIVFETDDEREAFDKEIALIAEIGSCNLCNLTAGGEGTTTPAHVAREYELRMRANLADYEGFKRSAHRQMEFRFKMVLREIDEELKESRRLARLEKKRVGSGN